MWRGHREDYFKARWDDKQGGPRPPQTRYMIYDPYKFLDRIIIKKQPLEAVVRDAVEFVNQRALEFGMVEEWADPWKSGGEFAYVKREPAVSYTILRF